MDIRIESLLEGAQRAQGTVVIIDVFRAFTTASVALELGVRKIIFVSTPSEAMALREAGKADLCVGEMGGMKPEGFDFGNSPYELSLADVKGKVLAHSTRAGTVGVNAATQADVIYGASLTNARATVNAILADNPERVTLVAMGLAGLTRTDEDEQGALYLRNLLQGRQPDHDAVRSVIRISEEMEKFMDPAKPYLHPEDIDFAFRIDAVDVAVKIGKEDGMLVAYL